MAKSKKSKKSRKRDDDLFTQLRKNGVRKSAADQLARASAGLGTGKKKAEKWRARSGRELPRPRS